MKSFVLSDISHPFERIWLVVCHSVKIATTAAMRTNWLGLL